jgi:hypothetical protein
MTNATVSQAVYRFLSVNGKRAAIEEKRKAIIAAIAAGVFEIPDKCYPRRARRLSLHIAS